MKPIVAVIPIFYPHISIIENIKSYAFHVDKLYLIYNSPIEERIKIALSNINNTIVLYSGDNIGISQALNLALEKAYIANYCWLLTMDQDSTFEDNFPLFLSHFKNTSKKNLIIFSPIHNKKFIQTNKTISEIKVPYVMTSGNLVNIKFAKKINGYNEDLFIDEVDHEFCFRTTKHNYHICIDTSIALNHHLGESHVKFKNIKLYPPIRLYYMTRNYLYLRKKYVHIHIKFLKKEILI